MKRLILPTLAVIAATAAVACGGSSSSNSSGSCGSSGSGGSSSNTSQPSGGYSSGTNASTPAPSGGAAAVKTASGSLGTFLVDSKGRTLYLWEADKGSSSTCNGACASAWPPLTTTGTPQASGSVKS